MPSKDRQPPRFVPTLTEVVEETPLVVGAALAESSAPAAACEASTSSVPPETSESFMPLAKAQPGQVAINLTEADLQGLAEQAMGRVMARVDAMLEERLRYALADLVQLHTAALYQAMRSEVEEAVRTSVQEAVAQEQLPQRSD